ncbi:hypothetical protein CKO42_20240 [Lamprobacter modestohalophilus]|uniref:Uncharacterized protein n=1 Tax=Lamprobacter modestohalophilus TaxID=1064514 RepID=A0A9X1B6B3_9GAMM|nr:hypothetical protein [Lamprobacter modestohalophilus]
MLPFACKLARVSLVPEERSLGWLFMMAVVLSNGSANSRLCEPGYRMPVDGSSTRHERVQR